MLGVEVVSTPGTISQIAMPFELLEVTAAYSNAVLVAIMPHVSDFSKALDLPVPQPVTISQVAKFGCSPRADHLGGRLILTNGYSFTFDMGAVVLYRSPHSYFSLQDPNRVPEFYGVVKVKQTEAVRIAQNALKRLGYKEAELHFDQTPKVTPPKRNEGREIARYLVEWIDKDQVTAGGIPLERTAVEIDASTGRIEMLGIQGRNARRPDPKISVQPKVIASQPTSQPVGGTRTDSVSPAYARAFLAAILPQLSDFVHKAGVDVRTPITMDDIDPARFECGYEPQTKCISVFVYLKTGDRFVYRHGQVIDFAAHNSYRIPEFNKPLEDKPAHKFYGPVEISTGDALKAAMKPMNDLGYTTTAPKLKRRPEVVPPRKHGTNYLARYFLNWWSDDGGMQDAVAEVDATTGKLKSFGINDRAFPNIWREPPKVNVPLTFETNASPPRAIQPPALPPPSLPPATPLK